MTDSALNEQPIQFDCNGARLHGIVARPLADSVPAPIAVLIAVGGPQYRVGSHRQFVLLARRLAEAGFASLRFDSRGMGDSEGALQTFEDIGPDLHAAIDALRLACPDARQVVVWGLCDAASGALMHAVKHPDVAGIVALNPWARSEATLAAVQVKHYYGQRLMQRAFWMKLLRGGVDLRGSIAGLAASVQRARATTDSMRTGVVDNSFQARMARGLAGFRGQMLLIIAGNDLTAKEFLGYTGASAAWRGLLDAPRVSRVDVPDADHTFSSRAWRAQVEDATIAWLKRLAVPSSR
jgi:uncharacterized protein